MDAIRNWLNLKNVFVAAFLSFNLYCKLLENVFNTSVYNSETIYVSQLLYLTILSKTQRYLCMSLSIKWLYDLTANSLISKSLTNPFVLLSAFMIHGLLLCALNSVTFLFLHFAILQWFNYIFFSMKLLTRRQGFLWY